MNLEEALKILSQHSQRLFDGRSVLPNNIDVRMAIHVVRLELLNPNITITMSRKDWQMIYDFASEHAIEYSLDLFAVNKLGKILGETELV